MKKPSKVRPLYAVVFARALPSRPFARCTSIKQVEKAKDAMPAAEFMTAKKYRKLTGRSAKADFKRLEY